jgi:hypothetical protein
MPTLDRQASEVSCAPYLARVQPESQWQTTATGYFHLAGSGVHDSSNAGARTDLPPEQYAYLPGCNARQVANEVEDRLHRGQTDVVDAGLADYVGSIPHADLMQSLARRIVDRRVLHLVRMAFKAQSPRSDTDARALFLRASSFNRMGGETPVKPLPLDGIGPGDLGMDFSDQIGRFGRIAQASRIFLWARILKGSTRARAALPFRYQFRLP